MEPTWRRIGLDRIQHRVDQVRITEHEIVVITRVAPAATTLALLTDYLWSATASGVRLVVRIAPEGEWSTVLPRLGLRMTMPSSFGHVEWFGLGPGEAYADTRRAALIGRYSATVEELQTPYVFPQENGNRAELRSLTLGRDFGTEVEVISGVAPNDSIIVDPPDSLVSGETVRVAVPSANEQDFHPAGSPE